jgi:hypothetical protein
MKTLILAIACSVSVLFAGCLMPGPYVGYVADRDLHEAGWNCPKAEDQSHWIAFWSPPCSWVPGGLFSKSCEDHYVANVEESRGCTQAAANTPGATNAH